METSATTSANAGGNLAPGVSLSAQDIYEELTCVFGYSQKLHMPKYGTRFLGKVWVDGPGVQLKSLGLVTISEPTSGVPPISAFHPDYQSKKWMECYYTVSCTDAARSILESRDLLDHL